MIKILPAFTIRLYEVANVVLNDLKITYGDTLLLDPAYKQIVNSDFDPEDLIYLLKAIVGSRGNVIITSFDKPQGLNSYHHLFCRFSLKREYQLVFSLIKLA